MLTWSGISSIGQMSGLCDFWPKGIEPNHVLKKYILVIAIRKDICLDRLTWRHDIHHNDTQHSCTQHNNVLLFWMSLIWVEYFLIVILSIVMLNVTGKCCITDCHCAECHCAECHCAECHCAECHCAECHCAECYLKCWKSFIQYVIYTVCHLHCMSLGWMLSCWMSSYCLSWFGERPKNSQFEFSPIVYKLKMLP